MAGRNVTELLAGAVVLAVAVGFLGYAVANTGRSGTSEGGSCGRSGSAENLALSSR